MNLPPDAAGWRFAMKPAHFRRELLPPAKSFYEHELGKLSPPARGWSRGRCPFHNSKSGTSFSVNLASGAFHCFGCDAHGGDLIAFVRLRDRLSFKDAAQRLGAWDEVPLPETVRRLEAQRQEQQRQRELEQQRHDELRRQRLQLRGEIHTAARLQREASDRLTELRLAAAPASAGEAESCWAVMVLALDDLRDCEAAYCTAAGLE